MNLLLKYDKTRPIYSNRSIYGSLNIYSPGAKKSTGVDLWRMVWQEKCNRIVMVANVEEMGRVSLLSKITVNNFDSSSTITDSTTVSTTTATGTFNTITNIAI